MSDQHTNYREHVSQWRAQATAGGRGRSDGAYGFGGLAVAEAVGTAAEVDAELTHFLKSLGRQEVEAQQMRTGRFFVRLEVEPYEHSASTLAARPAVSTAASAAVDTAEDRVPAWEAHASTGNADDVFDACCRDGNSQGDEAHLVGTAQAVGTELSHVLGALMRADVETMKYGTKRCFIELLAKLP